jgi:tripartite-type tricarboxylate transporter receptor subunit TctC
MKRLSVILLSMACLALGMATASAEDSYPNKPVKVIVPYAPGGATDIVARIIGDAFGKVTGHGFVVLNRAGAFGLIAIDEMAKATPDGYTLMIGNVTTNAITPVIYAKKFHTPYLQEVVPVTRLVDVPAFLLVTTTNFSVKSVPELVDYAKKNPGKTHYGTVGVGSYPHYDMAYFAKRAGDLDMVAIPNKNGASGVLQDMLRGDVQAAFLNVASSAGFVKAGKLKPIALVNHARLPDYPDIPTMAEVGYPDVGTIAWQGIFAPAGTPKPVLEKLFQDINKVLQSPEVKAKFAKQHFNIVPNKSVDDAKAWLGDEMKHWQTITQTVKLGTGG